MNWIKRAFGVAGAPPEKSATAQAGKAEEEGIAGPPCTFPDDIDFEEGSCSACANPCSDHKQVCVCANNQILRVGDGDWDWPCSGR